MDEKSLLKVSVYIATYNHEEYVSETIESLLHQTYPIDELIISDDFSTDNTWNKIKSTINRFPKNNVKKIILRRNPFNLGLIYHYNLLLKMTSNNLIIGHSGDDVSYPERIEKMIMFYKELGSPKYFLAHTPLEIINPEENQLQNLIGIKKIGGKFFWLPPYYSIVGSENIYIASVSCSLFLGPSFFITKNLYTDFGPILEGAYEDLIIGFRAMLLDAAYFYPEPLTKYRVSSGISWKVTNQDDVKKTMKSVLLQRAIDAAQVKRFDLMQYILSEMHKSMDNLMPKK